MGKLEIGNGKWGNGKMGKWENGVRVNDMPYLKFVLSQCCIRIDMNKTKGERLKVKILTFPPQQQQEEQEEEQEEQEQLFPVLDLLIAGKNQFL